MKVFQNCIMTGELYEGVSKLYNDGGIIGSDVLTLCAVK